VGRSQLFCGSGWIVISFPGRREFLHGSNACVRRVAKGATQVSHGRTRKYAPGLSEAGQRRSMVTLGLRGAGTAQRNGPGSLSAPLPATLRLLPRCGPARTSMSDRSPPCGSPCIAQKASDLQSFANPAQRMRRALFRTVQKQMARFTSVERHDHWCSSLGRLTPSSASERSASGARRLVI
jgi:hypothetical protein